MDVQAVALKELGLKDGSSLGVDFVSDDRQLIVALKRGQGGLRDLNAATLQLAMSASASDARRAILLLDGARMSADGLKAGWAAGLRVRAPAIAERLCLVALLDGKLLTVPDGDPFLYAIGRAADTGDRPVSSPRVDRSFEVMRVLLSRWLQRGEPITVKALQEQTGLSHPSVSKALEELDGFIERRRDRSVALRCFPNEAWGQLLARAPKVRQTAAFVDESGRSANPARLLERLQRLCPAHVAVGGVAAARRWHPALDLHGLPRLDLSLHMPDGGMETAFVEQLDPALVPAPRGAPPVLVLHAVPRAGSLFVPDPAGGVPWGDPVEVLLDLHELRLVQQADDLIRQLRKTP